MPRGNNARVLVVHEQIVYGIRRNESESFKVHSIMREISRKPIRFIRKASTATSLAALKTRGADSLVRVHFELIVDRVAFEGRRSEG